MKSITDDLSDILSKLSREDYCYLTTTGRKSGLAREIEIWFGINGNSLYLLSGGGDKSQWVKNLRANPNVTVRIAKQNFNGIARIVSIEKEEMMARYMLAGKYQGWKEGNALSDWGRTALVVGIDLSTA
ncbi:nitroreductase family deazaflavin-dependent oxidoreductase [Candidatus Villigracilis saccharophilus]|uniref:nitroreductase family deazaflavin-dependent oxidoreductase n=1 Tax=Candidatus Villigracilis saccharophilus TaxID=3140684 RepID=UPI003135BFE8|nr:nitroreductase family deazaflavin-dependent oxidoreductase [Anaerolineales bacterium]